MCYPNKRVCSLSLSLFLSGVIVCNKNSHHLLQDAFAQDQGMGSRAGGNYVTYSKNVITLSEVNRIIIVSQKFFQNFKI
jgi:hypothetical protein